jgi:DNA polymerase/3'-5' exonuclease PolX
MSTTLAKRSLAIATKEAMDFRELFEGTFERWVIAGSCRRQKPEVGDVEHVVIPKFGEVPDGGGGLFAATITANLVMHRADELLKVGTVSKHLYGDTGPRWGQTNRGMDYKGFNNEIFSADADNFGSVLTIRTGPSDYSRMLVTVMQHRGYRNRDGYVWNTNDWTCACGYAGNNVEYVRRDELEQTLVQSGARLIGGWRDKLRDDTEVIATCVNCRRHGTIRPAKVPVPTEEKFFEICGVKFCPPEERRG